MTHPYAVKDISVREYPDIQVWLDNVVKLPILLIPEESVRHPHLGTFCHGQVFDFPTHIAKGQPIVIPLLAKCNLNTELHFDIVYLLKTPNEQIH